VTTEELKNQYGYNHPPRASRDVRELGIPLETFKTKDNNGKSIGAYRFGNPDDVVNTLSKASGRTVLSKTLRQALVDKHGARCFIYYEQMDANTLQVDHRIPYEIGGEHDEQDIDAFMLISPSANRMKSWNCEHCENWVKRNSEVCSTCFWAYPESYKHIAGRQERVIMLVFTGEDIEQYDRLVEHVGTDTAQDGIKDIVYSYLASDGEM
jgi:hypothetical protein